ncbi:hypothetical protein V8C34DRAFT_281468 [Trichoderma compactum]
MRFFAPLLILLVGAAAASPLKDRQDDPDCYDICFSGPLPCPSNRVSKEIDGCWTCCLV